MTERRPSNEALLAVEKALKNKLQPVEPDQQFIGHLRQRLEDSPVNRQNRRVALKMLTIAAGLVIGLAIFLIGRGFIRRTGEA